VDLLAVQGRAGCRDRRAQPAGTASLAPLVTRDRPETEELPAGLDQPDHEERLDQEVGARESTLKHPDERAIAEIAREQFPRGVLVTSSSTRPTRAASSRRCYEDVARVGRLPVQLATRLTDWSAGGLLRCNSAARLSVCRGFVILINVRFSIFSCIVIIKCFIIFFFFLIFFLVYLQFLYSVMY